MLARFIFLILISINVKAKIHNLVETNVGAFYGAESGFFGNESKSSYSDSNGFTIKQPVRAFYENKNYLLIVAPLTGIYKFEFDKNRISLWSHVKNVTKINRYNGAYYLDAKDDLYQVDNNGKIKKRYFEGINQDKKSLLPTSTLIHNKLHIFTQLGYYVLQHNDVMEKKEDGTYDALIHHNDTMLYLGKQSKWVKNNTTSTITFPRIKTVFQDRFKGNQYHVVSRGGDLLLLTIHEQDFSLETKVPSTHYGNINHAIQLSDGSLSLATVTGIHSYNNQCCQIQASKLGVTNTVGASGDETFYLYRKGQGLFVVDAGLEHLIAFDSPLTPKAMAIANQHAYVATNAGMLVFNLPSKTYVTTLLDDAFIRQVKVIDQAVYVVDGYARFWQVTDTTRLESVFTYDGDYYQFAINDVLRMEDGWLLAANDGLYQYQKNRFSRVGFEGQLLFRLVERATDILVVPFKGLTIGRIQKSQPHKLIQEVKLFPGSDKTLTLDSALITDNQYLWLAVDDSVMLLNQDFSKVKTLCDNACYSSLGTLSANHEKLLIAADNTIEQIDWPQVDLATAEPELSVVPANGELQGETIWFIEDPDTIDSLTVSSDHTPIFYRINEESMTMLHKGILIGDLQNGDVLRFYYQNPVGDYQPMRALKVVKPVAAHYHYYFLITLALVIGLIPGLLWYKRQKHTRKVLTTRESKLNCRENSLTDREAELARRESRLADKEDTLAEKELNLNDRENSLSEKENNSDQQTLLKRYQVISYQDFYGKQMGFLESPQLYPDYQTRILPCNKVLQERGCAILAKELIHYASQYEKTLDSQNLRNTLRKYFNSGSIKDYIELYARFLEQATQQTADKTSALITQSESEREEKTVEPVI